MKNITWKKEERVKETVKNTEHFWYAEIDGYEIYLTFPNPDADGVCSSSPSLQMAPSYDVETPRSIERSFYLHPRSVDELDSLAAVLPGLLTALAEALRAEGISDLRTKWERETAEMMQHWRGDECL